MVFLIFLLMALTVFFFFGLPYAIITSKHCDIKEETKSEINEEAFYEWLAEQSKK